MKLFRIFFYSLLLFVLVCAIAVTLLIYMVDTNKLKPIITAEVKKRTGYEMVINGKLSWTLYPRLAIKVDKLTLAENDKVSPFIHLQGIKIRIELSDLLHLRERLPGTLYIASVNFKNVHAEDVWANLKWQNNGFIFKPIKSNLYGGNLEGVVSGTELSTHPQLHWDLQFNNIQLKPLLQDIHGKEGKLKIAGRANIKFNGKSTGKTKQQLLTQLEGNLQFKVNAGAVVGIDFNYFVQAADAILKRQKLDDLTQSNQTPFDQLTGTAVIKNGIARTNDLLLVSKFFVTKGEGSLILASQHVDATLTIAPKTQSDKIPWKIPLLISDNIKNPTVRLNMGEIQKLIIKKEIDKIKERARDQIKQHIPGKTGEFLQNLLGN